MQSIFKTDFNSNLHLEQKKHIEVSHVPALAWYECKIMHY